MAHGVFILGTPEFTKNYVGYSLGIPVVIYEESTEEEGGEEHEESLSDDANANDTLDCRQSSTADLSLSARRTRNSKEEVGRQPQQ